jgi:hypothetical protein
MVDLLLPSYLVRPLRVVDLKQQVRRRHLGIPIPLKMKRRPLRWSAVARRSPPARKVPNEIDVELGGSRERGKVWAEVSEFIPEV